MDRKMRVSDQNWERLKRWATPFEDSPDDALGKVLAIAETIHDASTLDQPRIPDQTLTNGYSIPQIAKGEKERDPTGNQDEIFNIDGVGETSRLPRGIRVPQQSFELPILESLHELEGRAKGTDVLAKVEPKVKCLLSEVDYQMVSNGTQIRWTNTAHFARLALVKRGLLKPVEEAGRGIWELTEQGIAEVKKNRS